jgi:hypothetical protein
MFVLVPLVPFVASGRVVPGSFQTRLYFSGTPERWVHTVADALDGSVELDDIRLALVLDLVFASSFAAVGLTLMRTGLHWWAPERRRRFGWWRLLPWAAVVAGTLDLLETTGQLVWLDSTSPPTAVTHLIAAVAWWKWVAYLAALVGLLGLVVGPIMAPADVA